MRRTGQLLTLSMPVSSSALPAKLLTKAGLSRASREALLAIFKGYAQGGLPRDARAREVDLVAGAVQIKIT